MNEQVRDALAEIRRQLVAIETGLAKPARPVGTWIKTIPTPSTNGPPDYPKDETDDPTGIRTFVRTTATGRKEEGERIVPRPPDPSREPPATLERGAYLAVIAAAHDYLKRLTFVADVAKDEVTERLKAVLVEARIKEPR